MRQPTNGWEATGLDYACEKLKEQVRAAFAKRTANSGPRGPVILAAVEALPDARRVGSWVLFDELTPEERAPLDAFITQTEINYHADEVTKLIDEKFPRST